MLIQERVLAAKPEAMLLAVAELQLLRVNLDDVWCLVLMTGRFSVVTASRTDDTYFSCQT